MQATSRAMRSPSAVFSQRHLSLPGEHSLSGRLLLAKSPFDTDLLTAWQPLAKPVQG